MIFDGDAMACMCEREECRMAPRFHPKQGKGGVVTGGMQGGCACCSRCGVKVRSSLWTHGV